LPELHVPLFVAGGDALVVDPDGAPGVRHEPVLGAHRLAGLGDHEIFGHHPRSILRMQRAYPQVGFGDPFLLRVPEHRLQLRAHVDGPRAPRVLGIGRLDVRHRRHVLDQRPVPLLGLAQLDLGGLALCDVQHHPLPVAGPAFRVAYKRGLCPHPHDRAVRTEDAVLGHERLARPRALLVQRQHARVIVRVGHLEPPVVGRPVVGRPPEELLDAGAHEHPFVRVTGHDVADHRKPIDELEQVLAGPGRVGGRGPLGTPAEDHE
jgi:hypothetical protein